MKFSIKAINRSFPTFGVGVASCSENNLLLYSVAFRGLFLMCFQDQTTNDRKKMPGTFFLEILASTKLVLFLFTLSLIVLTMNAFKCVASFSLSAFLVVTCSSRCSNLFFYCLCFLKREISIAVVQAES